MAKSSIDRNIMFGIVAVQTGTIAIDQMQASFRDWIKDKSKPVSEILKTRGVLSDDQCRALDTQVDVALEKSTDFEVVDSSDVNKSITASLQDFADDSDFQIFVDNLGINSVDNTHSISGNTVGSATSTGRFRIVRPHAKGGLGEVFVAIDEELNREVALKQIQSRGADNRELRDRFLREAEITG